MGEFKRDPTHWLMRLSPDEWIRAALGELGRAEEAWRRGDARAGVAGIKRAAGMALNGALLVEPHDAWGRTYVDHLKALAADARAPEAVRAASRQVLEAEGPSGLVVLRTPHAHEAVLEATRDVIAHAWTVVKRHEAAGP
jgi:HEPN domain-containing protein